MICKRLFLTKDTRFKLEYQYFIGWAFTKQKYYIRRIKLWNILLKRYWAETVLLKVVKEYQDYILVEITNA